MATEAVGGFEPDEHKSYPRLMLEAVTEYRAWLAQYEAQGMAGKNRKRKARQKGEMVLERRLPKRVVAVREARQARKGKGRAD